MEGVLSRIWVEHLRNGLEGMGFKQTVADTCVFFQGNLIFLHFLDDCICLSPNAAGTQGWTTRRFTQVNGHSQDDNAQSW
jgi:hypothetical protein